MSRRLEQSARIFAGISAVLFLAVALPQTLACAGFINSVPRAGTYVTDGTVNAIVTTPTTTYIGGSFEYVGPPSSGKGAPIDADTGAVFSVHPEINGTVRASAPDGSGGWYVGGEFTQIGTVARNRIAHLLADGTLDTAWNPDATGSVFALAVSGTTLYAGGVFTSIGGQPRNCIAALSTATGLATGWNPGPGGSSQVLALAVSGTTVYVGGYFSLIGGQTRNNIAALSASTGLATDWNPNASSWVKALVVSGSTVYAGGYFKTIGGQTRACIAALNATTGLATAWNPNPSGTSTEITSLAVSGSTVYAGGTFSNMGGQPRNCIAAVDAGSGLATEWDPNASGGSPTSVDALAASATTVYAGGWFADIGGQPRSYFAALDAATGLAGTWDANTDGRVWILSLSGAGLYVGGNFSSIGGQIRHGLAAFNTATGTPTDLNPAAVYGTGHGTVYSLALSGTTLYAGGYFTSIGGQPRNSIAAIDTTTGLVTDWDPGDEPGYVYALAVSGTTVYAGGTFANIGGQPRYRLAAMGATTGDATEWNPSLTGPNPFVLAFVVSGTTLYVGGDFTGIGGQPRNSLATFNTATGAVTNWNPNAGETTAPSVHALALSGTTLYVGGDYTGMGGQPRNCLAAFNTATGVVTAWNPSAAGATSYTSVFALAVSGTTICAGGYFTTIGGGSRSNLAGLDASTGKATAWNPGASTRVYALATSGSSVYAGGDFDHVGGSVRKGLAEFPPDTTPPTGTIVINNNRSATNSTAATLALTWDDGANSSGVGSMRFSNDGTNWSAWEAVAATRAYTLPSGDGYKTVRVQFLDKSNNRSLVYSDYIRLDMTAPTGGIVINSGAATTTTRSVTLGLNWADAGAGVSRVRFSDNGSNWTAWEPQTATRAYTLPEGLGYHTVRAQYRDGADNYSPVYNDYIKLVAP